MRRFLPFVLLLLPQSVLAQGILLPRDRGFGPLALVDHRVNVQVNDQVAITTVKQTFANPHSRALEAVYTFTVPKGASVREFSMLVNGKKVKGELVEAPKARHIYTEIVRRTQDPGLLEYIGTDVLQMSVFPVPAHGRQEVEISFTSLARFQDNTVEYLYPLKAQAGIHRPQGEFSFEMDLQSSKPIFNIYSPTHPISFSRKSDRHAVVHFDKSQSIPDRDLQLFYTTGKDDIGLTLLQHRPGGSGDGYFLLLLAPRAEIKEDQRVPRDMVFVLDTSGSMREDGKLDQAKKALKFGLDSLKPGDRFAILTFATTVNWFQDKLVNAKEQRDAAKQWVDALEPTGGTAIDDALKEALRLQTGDRSRSFTIVFLTDGRPTVGETNPNKILANFDQRTKESTRMFTFGVGYDLDAALIDRLAEKHKGTSSYVRPNEDMEIKVSGFFNQINQPVLTDLKLTSGFGPRLVEVYPPQLPDLFVGGQLVVLGRYQGTGKAVLRLIGQVGTTTKEFNYEVELQDKPDAKPYVEDLWARRKVGYLLDQLRTGGEKREIVDEVTMLAKRYGIATPYTSYLVVPDETPLHRPGSPILRRFSEGPPPTISFRSPPTTAGVGSSMPPTSGRNGLGLGGGLGGGETRQQTLKDAAERGAEQARDSQLGGQQGQQKGEKQAGGEGALFATDANKSRPGDRSRSGNGKGAGDFDAKELEQKRALDQARFALQSNNGEARQGQIGVDLSIEMNALKNQSQLAPKAQRRVLGRNCIEVNGVWIDDQFKKDTPTLEVKAMSNAYFKLLDQHPELKGVLQLGNALVWITPSGTALVIDPTAGKEELPDEVIVKLFAARK